jgi:multidrug efflux system membrane fusion protein
LRAEARRIAALVVAAAAVLGAAAEILTVAVVIDRSPRTDAAEIDAPFVHISPTTPGRVAKIGVADNALVKRGDVLFAIDPTPYQLRVDLAKAQVEAAQSEVDQGGRNIAGERANATVADEQIRRARDNLALAQQSLDRLIPLLPKGYVTAQQVDLATTARDDALVSLKQAEAQSSGANDVIGTLETRRALLAAAQATLTLAERDLADTVVRAPFDGRVTSFHLVAGEYVVTGQPLGSLIDTSGWRAVADFRETDLGRIRPGDKAYVFIMSDRNRLIHGEVEGIGWGVRSDETANVLGLPFVARSLNWVRVAQRYPVTVKLVDPPQELMRIGESAVVVLRRGDDAADGAHR